MGTRSVRVRPETMHFPSVETGPMGSVRELIIAISHRAKLAIVEGSSYRRSGGSLCRVQLDPECAPLAGERFESHRSAHAFHASANDGESET
jgi:hypothetical protein